MKTQIYSNPLIPMMAITGDLSRQQIAVILQRYLDKGITQFLMYPRDGCDVPYMSERWLTICRDFIETAASLGMEVWLYDEFNWPSGTCFGRVMEEDPAYAAKYVLVENGTCRIEETRFSNGRIPDRYADILQPDAVECFLRLTHEVYYKHFAPWFGTVIRGIFTDEPSFLYYNHPAGHEICNGGYPYFRDAEILYAQKTGRDLFADMAEGSEAFLQEYYALLGQRFREVYVDRLAGWCRDHGILLTGHLMQEHNIHGSVSSSGDAIHALRGFSLPGMDEISTNTSIEKAEWLTFGTVQAAVRQSEHGGLVETFALGPTDIPPARIVQMIWLEAMFNIDHYLLAVAAVDARGNVKKNGWYNPICYTNPWFEGFPELGLTAAEAAAWAQKTVAPEVYVRLPVRLTRKYLFDPEKKLLSQQRITALLRELTRRQRQWLLLAEDETAPENIPVLEITDSEDFSAEALADSLPARSMWIAAENGELPEDLFLREFTDGSAAILDLRDSSVPRRLFLHANGTAAEILLNGRGHLLLPDRHTVPSAVPSSGPSVELSPVFRLMTDRPNTLRCRLWQGHTTYVFRVEETLEGIRMLARAYMPGGQLKLDGTDVECPFPADALTPGLTELYCASAPFSLTPGEHTVTIAEAARSEMFLPSCFLCGRFACRYDGDTDVLYSMPETVTTGQLSRDILPQYAGRITLETMLDIPANAHTLVLDCCDLYTRVYLGGIRLDKQPGWDRFAIPEIRRGCRLVLRIEQFTSIAPVLGRYETVITSPGESKTWFPHKYEKCGIEALSLLCSD